MLSEIIIENLAVIEKAQISFGSGFTVLTGETGAGKSIMVDSIQAILGNRASKDLVRSGAEKARIWATFTNVSPSLSAKLEELGYPTDDDLILQRDISLEGKSQCRINMMPATAAVLKEIGAELVQIHGQHDNHSLTNESKHLSLLDLFAGHDALIKHYQNSYQLWQSTKKETESLLFDESEKNRKIDLLRYEIQEIGQANLIEGEEDALIERRNRQRNAQALMEALQTSQQALQGSDNDEVGAITLLGTALRQLELAAEISSPLGILADGMRDLFYSAQELERDIQLSIRQFEEEEETLNDLENRLDQLYRLKQKYGPSVEAVILYGQQAERELQAIEGVEERLQALSKLEEEQKSQALKLAEELSYSRLLAFERFSKDIQDSLQYLNMAGARLELRREQVDLSHLGQDALEFLFSANPGETPKPLSKIASGGELSRVMLAIKNALVLRDDMPTVIYDEIDTGISGETAGKIGRVLEGTACERQVLCVTHTAQIAAFADEHLFISKKVVDGRTYTSIQTLSEENRIDELARIMSGEQVTMAAKANAAEMLEKAKKQEDKYR